MKLEEFVKNKINQHKEAYNPKAWEQLSTRLDNVSPVKSGKGVSKMLISSIGVAAVTAVIVFVYNNNDTTSSKTKNTPFTEEIISNQEQTTKTFIESQTNSDKIEQQSEKSTVKSNYDNIVKKQNESEKSTIKSNYTNIINSNTNNTSITSVDQVQNKVSDSHQGNNNPTKFDNPSFETWKDVICASDNEILKNDFNAPIYLKGNQKFYAIPSKGTISTSDMKSGIYELQYQNVIYKKIEIIADAIVDFQVDKLMYENGLPYLPLKAIVESNQSKLTWSFRQQEIGNDNRVLVPAFNKGKETLNLTVDDKGCITQLTPKVDVDKDYDLLAMTAFNIESQNPRNRVFLPFALYERTTAFEMQIIDPATSEIIFVTHSIEQPWDGRNQKTGEMVEPNHRFIWSVRLKEKAPFESKSVYQGIVIRVTE